MDITFFSLPAFLLSSILFLVFCLKLVRSFSRSCSVIQSKLPPGPWRLPMIGSIHHLGGCLPHRRLRELSEKHGPVMWLQLGEISTVVVSSAEAAKEVLKTKDRIFGQRAFAAGSDVLLDAGSPVNLAEKIFDTACRIVSRSAFHRRNKLDDDGQQQEAMIFVCGAVVSMSPDIAHLFPSRKWLRALTGARRKYDELRRRIDVLLENIIAAADGDAGDEGEEEPLLCSSQFETSW
ncbi:cytochrome P450 71D7-like [Neltuma alba]|uniref:cytochrome P450 71D7-like n=1 Tax=Neltuma alba TaxID=207710 RepID=UPI0010A50997|nr:cytochrome P450 71D7-like [Prosopis alba]